jgi:hypothetical protein
MTVNKGVNSMTLLETVKLELDTLPEGMLPSVREFIAFQKYKTKKCKAPKMSDSEYLMSIPGMMESIQDGIDTPLSECIPLEDVWSDV